MVEDLNVYEPLARYRDEFKEKFARLARDAFARLENESGVDATANRVLVAQIRKRQQESLVAQGTKSRCTWGLVLLCLLVVAAGVGLYLQDCITTKIWPYCLGVLAVSVPLVVKLWKRRAEAASRLMRLQALIQDAMKKAWGQMSPLNRLYSWDMPLRLVEDTVPRLAFDPYFSIRRLQDLHALCGWDDAFNDGKSIVGAQSGVINGNPFVFGDCLEAGWGEQSYSGTLEISWLEEEEDSDGHVRLVRRHETLTASVTKPIPVYARRKFVVYGNDAAPALSFSRKPSSLSTDTGFFAGFRKRGELRKLEKFSRNLEDDSQYTLMANHEFETLFQTMDRDHEVEYRLLFTPLAQTQMLLLLKDSTVGYGDDFSFLKRRKINVLESEHLNKATIDTDPVTFHNWDLDAARAHFLAFNERFFKDVYFSLAPILAIPLYQQTRSHADIWKGIITDDRPNFWEYESLANHYGDERFRHPSCRTQCILKTREIGRDGEVSRVAVTAYGYRIIQRVDYVAVYGGDGNFHEVPVEWDEYVPVEQTREMSVTTSPNPADSFSSSFNAASHSTIHRAFRSYL